MAKEIDSDGLCLPGKDWVGSLENIKLIGEDTLRSAYLAIFWGFLLCYKFNRTTLSNHVKFSKNGRRADSF